MGLLTKLFGNSGIVRFEYTTTDGKSYVGTTRIESIGATKEYVEYRIKQMIRVQTGKVCSSFKIVDYCEC